MILERVMLFTKRTMDCSAGKLLHSDNKHVHGTDIPAAKNYTGQFPER